MVAHEEPMLTDELRSRIGVEGQGRSFEVDKVSIKRFAQAIGDPNPLYRDEAYAAKSRYHSIIAPPTFIANPREWPDTHDRRKGQVNPQVKGAPTRELNAGLRVECFQPVKPGDVITTRSKLIDAYEKRGKTGKYVYTVDETVCTNQRGEIVMKFGHTFARH